MMNQVNIQPDQASKQYFIQHLKESGFYNIIDTDQLDQFARYDIEAYKEGKRYIFELKVRRVNSNRYGDILVDEEKAVFLRNFESDFCYIVTFFEDCWVITDAKQDQYRIEQKYTAKTTDFSRRDYAFRNKAIYQIIRRRGYKEGFRPFK